MPALVFLPNMGKRPVRRKTLVSVTLASGALLEGEARLFNWKHDKKPHRIEGWREFMPGEVLHPENQPNNHPVHRRIFDGN
jgi:hypothetical protein